MFGQSINKSIERHPRGQLLESTILSAIHGKAKDGKWYITYNALRSKTLKKRIKSQRKIASHSNLIRAMLLV